MKTKKYTFTEAYNRIPYKEMKGFRAKAKKVLGVTSDNQFCNYKLGKSNLRLNQYAGLVALFAEYGIKDPIKTIQILSKLIKPIAGYNKKYYICKHLNTKIMEKKQTVVEKYDNEFKTIEEQLELFKAGEISHLFLINRIQHLTISAYFDGKFDELNEMYKN